MAPGRSCARVLRRLLIVQQYTFVTPDRSGVEFAKALFEVALAYPEAETIHLVMDNLSTHSPHYTPKHGSWLNQAEIEIGLFSRQCLGKRRIPDLATLPRGGCLEPPSQP